ncbi:MAG: hydroxymethylglutaryl-CoA synthase [Candidatus Helarchaeota archaeon]
MSGIIGYQAYVPRYRLPVSEIRKVWGLSTSGISYKAVPYRDEDSISMGIASTLRLFMNLNIDINKITNLYFASTSSPYIDKPVSTLLVSMLGLREDVFTTDLGGSAQVGVMALMNCKNSIMNGRGLGLLIVSDSLKSKPGTILERSFGSGAVSIVIGNENTIADITGNYTYSIEISDKWKGINDEYKVGDERFTRDYGFIPAISKSIEGLLAKTDKDINEFTHVIIQQPNGKAPSFIGKSLKFDKNKLIEGNIVKHFGDLGSVSVFMGLAKVLDNAKEGDEILIAAYSSGGCHTMSFKVNSNIKNYKSSPTVQDYIDNKIEISYIKYLQLLGQI